MAPLLHAPSDVLGSPEQPGWQMEPVHRSPLPGRPRVGRHGVDTGLSSALCSLPWEQERALAHRLCLSSPWNHSSHTQWRHQHISPLLFYFHTHSGYEQAMPDKISISVVLRFSTFDCSHQHVQSSVLPVRTSPWPPPAAQSGQ